MIFCFNGVVRRSLPQGFVQGVSGGSFSITGTPTSTGTHTINLEKIGGREQVGTSIETEVLVANTLTLDSNNADQTVCVGQTINPIDPIGFSFTGASNLVLSTGTPSWVNLAVDIPNQRATVSGTPPVVAGIFNFSIETVGGCGQQPASISSSFFSFS